MAESSENFLQLITPSGQITRIEFAPTKMTIGRDPGCQIQLESKRVSRQHAELAPGESGQWMVKDLGSRNGTLVNGRAISQHLLAPGDRIRIGNFELAVCSPSTTGEGARSMLWTARDGQTTVFMTLAESPAPRLHEWHLSLVSNLSADLVKLPDREARMTHLCRTLVQSAVRCDSAVVLRVELAGGQAPVMLCGLQMRAGSESTGSVQQSVAVPHSVVEAAIKNEQPVLAGANAAYDGEEHATAAAIVCPLFVEKDAADILYVNVPRENGTVDWLALVALAAEQFKKAELQIEARQNVKVNAALHHDLGKARKMQMSLVPKHPAVPGLEVAIGFEPCHWIGGDYADALAVSEGKVLLAVADVSGKGMAAAMVASGVHSIVHSTLRSGSRLDEMVHSLNQYLLESMDRQSFVTLLGALLDPSTGRAQCVNAGHPPMLIVNPDGEVTEMRYGRNPPLGVMPMTVELDSVELKPDQLMILFTDGISEMNDPRGKMLGLDGIREQASKLYSSKPKAPLNELSDDLTRKLNEIRGDAAVMDDRTFLLARRSNP